MHRVSALWQNILASPTHRKEIKAVIAGTTYTEESIISGKISGGIFDKAGIGNCTSRQIDIEIIPVGAIPRQADIQIYVRLVDGSSISEWIQKGSFFISKRKKNEQFGTLSITGYDGMLKTGDLFFDDSIGSMSWPMSQLAAAQYIARRIGTTVDPRTHLDNLFPIQYPDDEDAGMSMRDILSIIAYSNAGNWIMSDSGQLLLLGFGEAPPETNYLITEYGDAITFGGDRILV